MSNPNFDQILSTTLANHRKKLTDNVFLATPLLWFLTQKNRARMISGGHKIVEPLIYADGESGSYGEWEQLTITPQEGITAAEFDWKQLYATIAISGLQEAINNGPEQLVNLLKAKVMQAEKTLKTNLNVMLWGNGTGNGGKDWDGLGSIVGATGTVGGINSATAGNEYWRSQVASMSGATPDTSWANLQKTLVTAYNDASDGADTVDALFMAQDVFEAYEAGLQSNVRYEDVKAANAGFDTLRFKGGPIFWDKAMTAGDIYGINSDYINVVGHKDRWFKQSKFSPGLGGDASSADASSGAATTVDARYAVISTFGNLTTSNRSRHFKVSGFGVVTA